MGSNMVVTNGLRGILEKILLNSCPLSFFIVLQKKTLGIISQFLSQGQVSLQALTMLGIAQRDSFL